MASPNLQKFPVYSRKDEIIAALEQYQVIIVAGDTGTGKSTLLPVICAEAGYAEMGAIAITQPRRIAAVSLARYCKELFDAPAGKEVGYVIRYQNNISDSTGIVYMTDGILLSSLHRDPLLKKYHTIIIDEAHERSVNIDFLLGYMRTILPSRPELKVVISSATIDAELFSRVFNQAPIINVTGRTYTIDIEYRPVIELWKGESIDSYVEGAILAVEELCEQEPSGDILLFFSTIEDVKETVRRLRHRCAQYHLSILPLHGRLSSEEQKLVFRKYSGRKVVVATNVAETSLTVPGIRYVVDTGLVRVVRFDPRTGITRMPIERISQASARQRAGRCGRLENGKCIRLFSEENYLQRKRYTEPEIKRSNLSGVLLRMYGLGIGEPYRFPFLQKPSSEALAQGIKVLQELGALDNKKRLSGRGINMARFPVDPTLSCSLLSAIKNGVLNEVTIIAAALSVDDPLTTAKGDGRVAGPFSHPDSDYIVYINAWNALNGDGKDNRSWNTIRRFSKKYHLHPLRIREWIYAYEQLRRIIGKKSYPEGNCGNVSRYREIHLALLSGLIHGVAKLVRDKRYESAGGEEVRIASSSMIVRKHKKWVLFSELLQTHNVYGILAAEIKPVWVEKCFKRHCRYQYEEPWYDDERGVVKAYQRVTFHSLTLLSNRIVDYHNVNQEKATEVFIKEAIVEQKIGDRYDFINHNREIIGMLDRAGKKLRTGSVYDVSLLEAFYEDRIKCATRKELHGYLKKKKNGKELFATVQDIASQQLPEDLDAYSDEIEVASYRLPVQWEYLPDADDDGATITVPSALAAYLPLYYWEWQLPVLTRKRIDKLVSWLTHAIVKKGHDPADVTDTLVDEATLPIRPWLDTVTTVLKEHYDLHIRLNENRKEILPVYLWTRIKVVDDNGIVQQTIRLPEKTSDSLEVLRTGLPPGLHSLTSFCKCQVADVWPEIRLLEPYRQRSIHQKVPIPVFPAFKMKSRELHVEAFFTACEAYSSHAKALETAMKEATAESIAWELENMEISPAIKTLFHNLGYDENSEDPIIHLIERWVYQLPEQLPCEKRVWEKELSDANERVKGCKEKVITFLEQCSDTLVKARQFIVKKKRQYSGSYYTDLFCKIDTELERYGSLPFNSFFPVHSLFNFPDLMKHFTERTAAALLDPGKFQQVYQMVYPYIEYCNKASAVNEILFRKEIGVLMEMVETYFLESYSTGNKKSVTINDIQYQYEIAETNSKRKVDK